MKSKTIQFGIGLDLLEPVINSQNFCDLQKPVINNRKELRDTGTCNKQVGTGCDMTEPLLNS